MLIIDEWRLGSTDPLIFRRAADADVETLQALAWAIWREYYPSIISLEQIEYMLGTMYSSETIRDELARGVVWELVHGPDAVDHDDPSLDRAADSPAGYLSFTHDEDAGVVVLHKLYVLPRLHGRGIGRAMLERVSAAARRLGARAIRLQVNKRNTRAIQAYDRAGYRIAGAVVVDIGGGFVMDDWVMVREERAEVTEEKRR